MVEPGLEDLFPGLRGQPYVVQSPRDTAYNCIAWAAGVNHAWWWPDVDGEDHWPEGAERAVTVEAFRAAFATLGYSPCAEEVWEEGFEKIALYAVEQVPKHAARQLSIGRWTSKLGLLEDIEHGLHDLAGTEYGAVVLLMKRPTQ